MPIYTLTGFQTLPRLTNSVGSRLYAAVDHLPEDLRRYEVFRGFAVGLLSYLAAISHVQLLLSDFLGDGLGDPSGSPSKSYGDTPILYGLPQLRPCALGLSIVNHRMRAHQPVRSRC